MLSRRAKAIVTGGRCLRARQWRECLCREQTLAVTTRRPTFT